MVETAASLRGELHDLADAVLGNDDRRAYVRLFDALALRRHVSRVVHLDVLARWRFNAIGDARSRHEQVEIKLALEPLTDDLHVQEAQESAPESEPECLRRLRFVRQRGV